MFNALFELDESQNVIGFDVFFRTDWWVAIILIIAAIVFAVYLYRSERELPQGWRRFLIACQVIALLLLITLILRPVAAIQLAQTERSTILVLIDTSQSMATQDLRTQEDDVKVVTQLLGSAPLKQSPSNDTNGKPQPTTHSASTTNQGEAISRSELIRVAIEHPEIKLVESLAERFDVRIFTFDDQILPQADITQDVSEGTSGVKKTDSNQSKDKNPEGKTGTNGYEWLSKASPIGKTSQIGSAIDDAVARYTSKQIAGVVVLSDFAWIKGKDPVTIAKQLKSRGIPIFPVVVGLPAPPDIHVRRIIAPQVVFKGDRVPIRVQIDSTGYAGETIDLALTVDGDTQGAISQQVELTGDVQFEQLMFTPDKDSGNLRLNVSVDLLPGEATDTNNQLDHNVRILDEKIKVLYVEGMPRWEYRYLRWVLLRDPRLEVTFLMTQGDPELARTSPQHLSSFPSEKKNAFKYDLIILGDVHAKYFKAEQAQLIDDLVRKSGGSLLMVAGPLAAPTSYRETQIGDLLPINISTGQWQVVGSNVHPVVTPQGRESLVTSLGNTEDATDRIWARVKPLHSLPPLNGAKPGSTTLLSLPKDSPESRDYPLVAWQRIGTGKTMFVGTEDLWRMRFEVGSRYHARFWGQTIQFLTLSRLLGQNKQITLETNRMTYNSGEQIKLFANVLTESFDPVDQPSYTVIMQREDDTDSAVEVELQPVPDTPGLYTGIHLATNKGTYSLSTLPQDASISNTVEMQIVDIPLEQRNPAAQPDIAKQIANVNGQDAIRLIQLADLPNTFKDGEPILKPATIEKELWDIPAIFILLLIVTGIEWYARRKHNLV
jgi:hypothetical protein